MFHLIQDRPLEPTFIVDITGYEAQKMEAVLAYKSQFYDAGSEEPQTYIASQAFLEQIRYRDALWGKRIGRAAGEGFISVNLPGIADFDSLLYPEMA